MLKVRASSLALVCLVPVFYGVSVLLLTYYVLGDQVHYWRFYEALASADVSDVMRLARRMLTSSEPVTAYVLWVGAQLGFGKSHFVALLNTILSVGVFLLLRKYHTRWYVFLLILTNFYLIVLMTGAERLKIAYMLLTYSAVLGGRIGMIFALISPLAHLSSFIILAGLFAARFNDVLRSFLLRFSCSKSHLVSGGAVLSLGFVAFLFVQDGVISKGIGYMRRGGEVSELLNIAILLIVGGIAARNRLRLVIALFPLIVATFLISGQRVNMLSFSLVLYLLLIERRLHHPLVLALLVYFSVKSIPFINNVFIYGNGFAGWLL